MIAKLKEEYLDNYCIEMKYTVDKTPKKGYTRIDISNLREKINIDLYESGSIVIGGSPKLLLKKEFEELKKQMNESPEILEGLEKTKIKACASKYNILLSETRNKIKDSLNEITPQVELFIEPTPSEEYRAKLSIDRKSLSITQYRNGTLFLQGKEDLLYHNTCDFIEKMATPADQEVIMRFISSNDEAVEKLSTIYTPKLTLQADLDLKNKINDVYSFLDLHDLKWFIAAESLRLVNIPLPEFSPIIMPASKAFEGFIKKLLVKISFLPATHFNSKTANFSTLKDRTNPVRKNLEAIDNHAGTYLDKISVCLDTNRNFMMHSDGSTITKIESFEEASKKLDDIYNDMLDIYKYFKNSGFGL